VQISQRFIISSDKKSFSDEEESESKGGYYGLDKRSSSNIKEEEYEVDTSERSNSKEDHSYGEVQNLVRDSDSRVFLGKKMQEIPAFIFNTNSEHDSN